LSIAFKKSIYSRDELCRFFKIHQTLWGWKKVKKFRKMRGKALEDEKRAVEYINGLGRGGGDFQSETTEGIYGFAGGDWCKACHLVFLTRTVWIMQLDIMK
jgi:hypothetical protein